MAKSDKSSHLSAMEADKRATFKQKLEAWASEHPRPLPWKGIRDPYRIWLSEIILQQTRVAQGLPYYERFVAAYPTVDALAAAPESEVFQLWEGLGYYSRARNLIATARHISHTLGGQFPQDYDGIRALKGIGPYTAAAIASFAFDLPHAVVDGNVYRVLARWAGIETPVDTTEGKQQFALLAQSLLDTERPAAYNQAMMDFGATWCTPQQPQCLDCPFQGECRAFIEKKVAILPMKSKKLLKKERFFIYFVVRHQGHTFLKKRLEKDIWQDLYTFPGVEVGDLKDFETPLVYIPAIGSFPYTLRGPFKQTLTHRVVKAIFVEITIEGVLPGAVHAWLADTQRIEYNTDKLDVPVPRLIDAYWQASRSGAPELF